MWHDIRQLHVAVCIDLRGHVFTCMRSRVCETCVCAAGGVDSNRSCRSRTLWLTSCRVHLQVAFELDNHEGAVTPADLTTMLLDGLWKTAVTQAADATDAVLALPIGCSAEHTQALIACAVRLAHLAPPPSLHSLSSPLHHFGCPSLDHRIHPMPRVDCDGWRTPHLTSHVHPFAFHTPNTDERGICDQAVHLRACGGCTWGWCWSRHTNR